MSDSEGEYQAKVLYDFAANTENELDIRAGEIVTVLEEDDPWTHVKNTENEDGYVPSNYIERVEEPAAAPPPPPKVRGRKPPPRAKVPRGPQTTNNDASWIRSAANMDEPEPPTPKSPAPRAFPPNPIRGRPKAQSMDASPAWNVFAASLEWWACLATFISGIFSILWGSGQVPFDQVDVGLGCMQCVGAASLLVYCSLFRDKCAEKAAMVRALLFAGMTITCWPAYPLGLIGGGALILASLANVACFIKRASLLGDQQVNVGWITMNLELDQVFKSSWGAYGFFALHLAAQGVYFWLGMKIGQNKVEYEESENRLLLGNRWQYAEAWGTMIACNLAWLFVFSLYGLHDYLIEWARIRADEEGCCIKMINRFIFWMFVNKRQLFLHRVFAFTILIASCGHMFEAYNTYESSGAGRDYIAVYGNESFATGIGIVWCMVIIFSAVNPTLVTNHRKLFITAHSFWGVMIILLIIHGKNFLGENFWKFMIGPLGLYFLDRLFRSGGNVALKMQEATDLA